MFCDKCKPKINKELNCLLKNIHTLSTGMEKISWFELFHLKHPLHKFQMNCVVRLISNMLVKYRKSFHESAHFHILCF